MGSVKSLKGMPDILPSDVGRWLTLEKMLREALTIFGYQEIRTPLLEKAELFSRSIGTTTDVVEKEMYTFQDKDGDSISLRPEGTASVVRSYIENSLGHGNDFLKLYYIGPMFRHERPQKGRLRQFNQLGVEVIGRPHPTADVDVLMIGSMLTELLQIPQPKLELNSVGDSTCRPAYREKLVSFLKSKTGELCENCKRRIESNPMRVLDCKNDRCLNATKNAPLILEHLCAPCKEHFSAVQSGLKAAGISFQLNPRIVRGLDYYTRTAFEFVGGNLGSQNAIIAGGRYDGLIEELGGSATPAVGFASGLERLLLSSESIKAENFRRIDIIPLDMKADEPALQISKKIRESFLKHHLPVQVDVRPSGTSLKAALRRSNSLQSEIAIILGESEIQKKQAQVKLLNAHSQEEVPFSEIDSHLLKLMKEKSG